MPFTTQPLTLADALTARAGSPESVVVAGGTGVMVSRNAGGADGPLLDLSRVRELTAASHRDGVVRLGATVSYTRVIEELAGPLPGVAAASRTIASLAIRNRATPAGALALADPSSDVLAALVAAGADVELQGPRGVRRVAAGAFVRAPGRTDLDEDELVTALLVPVASGPATYAKAGARNAMARAVCGVAVALDVRQRTVRIAVVGAAPTAVRALEAEALAAAHAPWHAATPGATTPGAAFGPWPAQRADLRTAPAPAAAPLDPELLAGIAAAVARAVDPSDDARGSAAHRRRIAGVLATRALARAWAEFERC